MSRLFSDPQVRALVELALREDIGSGDITTRLTVPEDAEASGVFVAREPGVLAGIELAADICRFADDSLVVKSQLADGERFDTGSVLAEIRGNARSLLTVERTALNFLQRLCGMATLTARYVEAAGPHRVRVLDTRKTIPGWRALSKHAVRVGGGYNHRYGLYDGILIKDNHIALLGSVKAPVDAARKGAPHTLRVEVEVDTLNQLDEALEAGADIVLLDNMSPDDMRIAVERTRGRALLEASGGIRLEHLRAVAETGVDLISVGAITDAAPPIDIALDMDVP